MDSNNNNTTNPDLESFLADWKKEIGKRQKVESPPPPSPIVQIESYVYPLKSTFLQDLACIIIRPCAKCLEAKKTCKHISGDELAFFYRMRPVCRQWRDRIDTWLRVSYFTVWNHLLHGHGIKVHVPWDICYVFERRREKTHRDALGYGNSPPPPCICYSERYERAMKKDLRDKLLLAGAFVPPFFIYENDEMVPMTKDRRVALYNCINPTPPLPYVEGSVKLPPPPSQRNAPPKEQQKKQQQTIMFW